MTLSLDAKTLREHPWLAPKQMALAAQVMENEFRRKAGRYAAGQLRRDPPQPHTHCGRGHAMSGDNLRIYRYEEGGRTEITRQCVTCERMRYARKKAQAALDKEKKEQALKLLRKYGLPEKLRRGAAA